MYDDGLIKRFRVETGSILYKNKKGLTVDTLLVGVMPGQMGESR